MRVLLSIVAVAAVAAAELPTTDVRCKSLDTSCEDIFRAIQCNTVKPCISRWQGLVTPIGNDTELCATCKKMVQEAKDNLLSNLTQGELREVLEGSCDVLVPIDPLKTMCKKLMDAFQDELNDVLISRMDPSQVCQVSGLCWKSASSNIEERASEMYLAKVSQKSCRHCTNNMEKLSGITNFVPQSDIVEGFSKVCQQNGFGKLECDTFSQTHLAKLLHIFKTMPKKSTCQFLGQCQGLTRPLMLRPADNMECEFCEAMIHKVVVQFNNTSTKEQVKTVLENICKRTGSWAAECQQRIDNNFDEAYDELISLLQPNTICSLIGICNDKQKLEMLPTMQLAPTRKTTLGSTTACSLCKYLTKIVLEAIDANFTQTQLIKMLDVGCDLLPVNKNSCHDFVSQNLPQLIMMLEMRYNVVHVCSESLHLCPTETPSAIETETSICEECEKITSYLVAAVNNNRSEENIKAILEKTCEIIPMDVGSCQQFIDEHINQLFDLLRRGVSKNKICRSLALCSSQISTPQSPRVQPKSICSICGIILNYIIDKIGTNRTEAAILHAFEDVCVILPIDRRSCQNTIDVYGNEIIKLLIDEVAPDLICASIGLCEAQEQSSAFNECTDCQIVTKYLIDELKTENVKKTALSDVCKNKPMNSTRCQKTIDKHGSAIVEIVANDDSQKPIEVCGTIGTCKVPKLGMDKCAICQTMAGFLIDELKDNKTDAAILDALTRVCKVIPIDRVECENMVETYGQLVISMILQDATADEICRELNLCSTKKVIPVIKGNNCVVCRMMTNFLEDELKDNRTDAAIVSALEKVCQVVPVDSATCRNIIDTYGNYMIELLKNDADEICSAIGVCDSQSQKCVGLRSCDQPIVKSDDQTCPMCQIVVHVVEAQLQNNQTQKVIEEVLQKACSLMPEKDVQLCKNMIDVYTSYIIEMVESMATAEQICQAIGLCSTPPSTTECKLCLFITNFVESGLSENRTETEIQHLLDRACDYLPNMDKQQCKQTINQYADMIITLLVNTVPPRKICEEIKLCPLAKKLIVFQKNKMHKVKNGDECAFCKWLVNWVDEKILDNRTEAAIVSELDKACDLLSDAGKCRDLVKDYTEMIVQMLIQYAEPEKICEAIKKCPQKQFVTDEPPCRYCRYIIDELRSDVQISEAQLKQKLDGICRVIPVDPSACENFVNQYADRIVALILNETNPEKICETLRVCPKKIHAVATKCEFCREALGFVISEVNDETTDDEILKMVEKLCTYVPAIHREDCRRMIEIEGLIVVRMIAESLDAESICDVIKFCPEKRNHGKLTCTWCQYALHYIQEKLYDNSTQTMIQQELEKMCEQLPGPEISHECKEFVDVYGPSLEVILAQDLDPSLICPAINACSAKKQALRPVRQPSTRKCHDCVSAVRNLRHDSSRLCAHTSDQFYDECMKASSIGAKLANAFGSDFKICKYAKSCSKIEGAFDCNRGGCQLTKSG